VLVKIRIGSENIIIKANKANLITDMNFTKVLFRICVLRLIVM